jgi:hypothetical protein
MFKHMMVIAAVVLLPLLASAEDLTDQVSIDAYTLVSQTRIDRVTYEMTYSVAVTNTGTAAAGVVATLANVPAELTVVDDQLDLGDLDQAATASDTFTCRVTRGFTLDPYALEWTVEGDTTAVNQALLNGPLASAEISAYLLNDHENPVEGPLDSDGSTANLAVAGTFDLALDGIDDDEWIVVSATGGQDIDTDLDTAPDAEPVVHAGVLHALVRAGDWRAGGQHVTPITDIAWRFVRNMLDRVSPSDLDIRLTDLAKMLIASDLDGDGLITESDIAVFDPRWHVDDLNFDYAHLFSEDDAGNTVIDALYAGDDETVDELLEDLFSVADSPFADTDYRYTQVQVDVFPFGRGRVESDAGGILLDTEDADDDIASAWFDADPSSRLTLTATPIETTEILGWTGCDSVSTDLSQCSVALDRSHEITVDFGYKDVVLAAPVHDLTDGDVILTDTTVELIVPDTAVDLAADLATMAVGDVVFGPDGTGFLRWVRDIEVVASNHYRLTTEIAALGDVILQGTAIFRRTLTNGDLEEFDDPDAAVASVHGLTAGGFEQVPGVQYIPSDDPNDPVIRLQIGGGTGSGDAPLAAAATGSGGSDVFDLGGGHTLKADIEIILDPDFGISFCGFGCIDNVRSVFRSEIKASLEHKASLAGSFSKSKHLKTFRGKPIPIRVWVLKFYVTPIFSIYIGASGKAEVAVSSKVEGSHIFHQGWTWYRDAGKRRFDTHKTAFKATPPDANRGYQVKAYARLAPALIINESVGPSYKLDLGMKGAIKRSIVKKPEPEKVCDTDWKGSVKGFADGKFAWQFANNPVGRWWRRVLAPTSSDSFVEYDLGLSTKWDKTLWEAYLEGPCTGVPYLSVNGPTIDDTVSILSPRLLAYRYELTNTGEGELPWRVNAVPDGIVNIDQSSGKIALNATEPDVVYVTIDTSTLPLGKYRNTLRFKNEYLGHGFFAPASKTGTTKREVDIVVMPELLVPTLTDAMCIDQSTGELSWTFDFGDTTLLWEGLGIEASTDGGAQWSLAKTVDIEQLMTTVASADSRQHFRMYSFGTYLDESIRSDDSNILPLDPCGLDAPTLTDATRVDGDPTSANLTWAHDGGDGGLALDGFFVYTSPDNTDTSTWTYRTAVVGGEVRSATVPNIPIEAIYVRMTGYTSGSVESPASNALFLPESDYEYPEITVTGHTFSNTCAVEQIRKHYHKDGYPSGCSGSAVNALINSWSWIKPLEGCEFPTDDGEYLDTQIPSGYVVKSESILSDSTSLVFDSTYMWGTNAYYIPGTGYCYFSHIFGYKSFDWVADVNMGYTRDVSFERVYECPEEIVCEIPTSQSQASPSIGPTDLVLIDERPETQLINPEVCATLKQDKACVSF